MNMLQLTGINSAAIAAHPLRPPHSTPLRRSAFVCRTASRLNPSHRTLQSCGIPATSAATSMMTASSTQTHISNLERLLEKQAPAPINPPPPLTQPSPKPAKDPDVDDLVSGGFFQVLKRRSAELLSLQAVGDVTMSPRSLTRLHRQLSDTNRSSPRGSIAADWRSYHGSSDWDGLLDPLDDHLRRELVRYGDFIHAAYHAFHSPLDAPSDLPRPVVLPDRSFRVTGDLFANASIQFHPLVEKLLPTWSTERSSWVGYVAVCDCEREIRRMGRREIVVVLRGTSTCLEWAENLRAGLVQIGDYDNDGHEAADSSTTSRRVPKVAHGFQNLYKTPGEHVPSLSSAVVNEVRRLVERYKGEELSVSVTGHSLGAALAVLAADELRGQLPADVPVAVFSFGGPKVGNSAFSERVKARGAKVLRVANAGDVVTRVPGLLPPGEGLLDGYTHVGQELRVDTKMSPYLKPDADPGCCHDLEAYLHLVDGFMGSDCPFRANAKRNLAKLFSLQGSNMKKLYMSEAKAKMNTKLNRSMPMAGAGVTPEFARCGSGQLAGPLDG